MIKILKLWIIMSITPCMLCAQITEREYPAEWCQLTKGGKYMDHFLPMKGKKMVHESWGTKDVLPRLADNGIEMADISFWGGNILQDNDKKYNMFVCGWPENATNGHMEWRNSTVYRATSKRLHGPYIIQDTIGKGHNPEAFKIDDGKYVVYVIDGYYMASTMQGPWEYHKFEFDKRGRKIIEGLSNMTFARRQDGSFLSVCRGGGVWISRTGESTYNQITEKCIYPNVEGEFEDPVIWRDSLQYHLIVNDWLGRIAFYQRSLDGVYWVTEQGQAYVPGISRHKDGHVEKWFKYERAKVFQDREGRAVQMNFAVIDTIKWEDKGNDNHSSKNICIPLRKDLLLSVLNTEPIDAETETIRVRIKAEKGFSPADDLDIASLRFGCFTEVNYGRGSKPLSWDKDGKDLVVTFDGENSGIGSNEFAPKLIGRDTHGNPVTGYAKLPYINYKPAILSAVPPVYSKTSHSLTFEVQNFGLSVSKATIIQVKNDWHIVAQVRLPSLKPYEKKQFNLKIPRPIKGSKTVYTVSFQ